MIFTNTDTNNEKFTLLNKKKFVVPRTYLCIDLKSFYASVESVERNLDVMSAKLVVADPERTDKTICLAVSPALKKLGVKNRCRLFEIPKDIDYIIAPPRMKLYIAYSAEIYSIYLKYVAKEDIHVYSVDEAFLDVTEYLSLYHMDAVTLAKTILEDIYHTLKLRATCGIGTNLYLAKIALDITAKHSPDFIGYLDEQLYCSTLWNHTPLTDFWRIGSGTVRKLSSYGINTMGQIAAIAQKNDEFFYNLFGVDAELLIDHAFGQEPVTIADIKSYHPKSHSISSGQVLSCDYSFDKAELIVKEMVDLLCLELVDKRLVTNSITLQIGYSRASGLDYVSGTARLPVETSSDVLAIPSVVDLFRKIVNPCCMIRRINLSCNNVAPEDFQQYSIFMDTSIQDRHRKIQQAMLNVKKKYGKNAILKGMNLEEGATTKERNEQIGGHRCG